LWASFSKLHRCVYCALLMLLRRTNLHCLHRRPRHVFVRIVQVLERMLPASHNRLPQHVPDSYFYSFQNISSRIRLKTIYQRPPLLVSSISFNTSSCNSPECKYHLFILLMPKIHWCTRYNASCRVSNLLMEELLPFETCLISILVFKCVTALLPALCSSLILVSQKLPAHLVSVSFVRQSFSHVHSRRNPVPHKCPVWSSHY
jgi:hypothetical protein